MGRSVIDIGGELADVYVEHDGGREITSVRVYRLDSEPFGEPSRSDDDDPRTPWQMDGIDMRLDPPRVTEEVWNFTSFTSAIASADDFASHYTVVPRPA